VPNITVTVPDEVYRAARIAAAEQGSSVSALVAGYLRGLSSSRSRFDQLLEQQRAVQASVGAFRAGDRLSRDEVHDRALR